MPIRSKIHPIHYLRPVVLWFFFNLILSPAYVGDTELTMGFIFISATIIFVGTAVHHSRKSEMIIGENSFILLTRFPKRQEKYFLKDIIDFTWSGRPFSMFLRHGPHIRLSNHNFELHFDKMGTVTITEDQYANFSEIRKFFYNYCIDNGIIKMRPLEERKKSRLRKILRIK